MKAVQCRMARAALTWTTQDLASKAGVGVNTVNRFEAGQDARVSSVDKMRTALEAVGVEFTNGESPGVRLRKGKSAAPTPTTTAAEAAPATTARPAKGKR